MPYANLPEVNAEHFRMAQNTRGTTYMETRVVKTYLHPAILGKDLTSIFTLVCPPCGFLIELLLLCARFPANGN